jgi:hypothetical protein
MRHVSDFDFGLRADELPSLRRERRVRPTSGYGPGALAVLGACVLAIAIPAGLLFLGLLARSGPTPAVRAFRAKQLERTEKEHMKRVWLREWDRQEAARERDRQRRDADERRARRLFVP